MNIRTCTTIPSAQSQIPVGHVDLIHRGKSLVIVDMTVRFVLIAWRDQLGQLSDPAPYDIITHNGDLAFKLPNTIVRIKDIIWTNCP
jgi:hypothetical protein